MFIYEGESIIPQLKSTLWSWFFPINSVMVWRVKFIRYSMDENIEIVILNEWTANCINYTILKTSKIDIKTQIE